MQVVAVLSYVKIRQIGEGQGRNSQIFLARVPSLGAELAIKEIPRANFGPAEDFFREAKTLHLTEHANVVPIRFACENADLIILAMDHFPRGSLQDLTKTGPLGVRETLRIGIDVFRALEVVHTRGLIHFDVKPSNVLLANNGTPMLADFGQTRQRTPDGLAELPPLYRIAIPPEALRDGTAALTADIYQAAFTLYRCVNGDGRHSEQLDTLGATRDGLKTAIVEGRFPDRTHFLPHVPKSLRRIIRKGLSLDPSRRYQSASDFRDALGRVEVELDWDVELHQDGSATWRAKRDKQPQLMVRLVRDVKPGTWTATVATVHKGVERRKVRFCRSGMTRRRALTWLTQSVFPEL